MNWATLHARFAVIAGTLWAWFRSGIKLLTAFFGIVLTIAIAFIVTTWIIVFGEGLLPPGWVTHKRPVETADVYYTESAAHASIGNWVLRCVGANSPRDLPENLQFYFYGFVYNPALVSTVKTAGITTVQEPTVQEMSVVQLSNAIAGQAIELREKANDSYVRLQYLQWLTILIGLATTVVVSVSSTELFGKVDTRLGKGLRLFAILLPALGTAVAAVNAFYSPRDEWNKATIALANLAQLHGQMSVGIWALDCPAAEDSRKPLVAKLEEWTKRYNDVITVAQSTGANKQGQAGSQGGDAQRQ